MPTYYEYRIDEETTILVAGPDEESNGGLVPVSRSGKETGKISLVEKNFREAFQGVKASAQVLFEEINELQVSEAEIKFGLATTGELGFGKFAVVKAGGGMNFEVTLKWKRPIQGVE